MLSKLIILCLIVETIQAPFKSLVCNSDDKDYGEFTVCRIKLIGRNKKVVNIHFLVKKLVDDLEIHAQVFKRENGWHPFLFKTKIEMCKFLAHPYDILIKIAYGYIKPYTNLNHTCPYKPNEVIKVSNFDLDLEHLRNLFPVDNGLYMAYLSMYHNHHLIASINVTLEFFDYRRN